MSSFATRLASGISRFLPHSAAPDDPLVSLKAAQRWVENWPVGDVYKCQQGIFNVLLRFNERGSGQPRDSLAIFMLLDERSRDLQDTLVRQYLRNPRMSRTVESQLWHAVYGLNWEIARGYHGFVQQLTHDPRRTPDKTALPLVTLRGLCAFGQLLKWRAVRYLPASDKLWLRLHNLYRVAEIDGFHRRMQQAYPGESNDCTCESAYLHALMLNLANSGTLYPRQIDLLDRWLSAWHAQLRLDSHLDPENHNFVVDLSTDHGPRRARKISAEKPMRFWSTGRLLVGLRSIQEALHKGETPDALELPGNPRPAESIDLIEHLLNQWAPLESREQRRAPRMTTKRLVDVVHGFSAITSQIKQGDAPAPASPGGSGFNHSEADDVLVYGFITNRTRERVSQLKPRTGHDVERWIIQDESDCGFGAVVESRDKDWLRVGALIATKSHETAVWRLGIVRRLSRVNGDTRSVGIETLGAPPTLVMLYDTTPSGYTVSGQDHNNTVEPHASLLLGRSGQPQSLVLDPAYYLPDRTYRMTGTPRDLKVKLGKPIERSEGWIQVSLRPVRTP